MGLPSVVTMEKVLRISPVSGSVHSFQSPARAHGPKVLTGNVIGNGLLAMVVMFVEPIDIDKAPFALCR